MEFEASIATADMTGQDRVSRIAFAVMVALIVIAPFFAYPFFVMQAMCFALFACAFNLLIGYANLLSLGHAMFFGLASYVCAHAAKVWGWSRCRQSRSASPPPPQQPSPGRSPFAAPAFYFAMITVAFSQMVFFVCVEAVHPWRGRYPGGAQGRSRLSICPIPGSSTSPARRVLSCWAFSPTCTAMSTLRRDSPRRSAKTSRALCRSAIARCNASCGFRPVGGDHGPRRRDQGAGRPRTRR